MDNTSEIKKLGELYNELVEYVGSHYEIKEIKSWAYTFLGDSANIRCGEEIKVVNIFQGDKRYEFTIPKEELLELNRKDV